MKILVIGSGGREHALAWKLVQSNKVSQIFVAPGNTGTSLEDKIQNINLKTHEELIEFCRKESVDFTVVGPEAPLAEGIVDDFIRAGLKIFGPTQFCSQLESSKNFAKQFMKKYNIPTAKYQTFSDATLAHQYIDEENIPIVIKADGLAAGKGVIVATSKEEAHQAIDDMLLANKMGDAGANVVIEEFLKGEEASFIVMVDGESILPMATSQDHKRLLEDDKGPNTGGMGAYSPALVVTESVYQKAMKHIIIPTVEGMKKEGHPYVGFLYAGLMIDEKGDPYTVEFNCRFGDPETQPVMVRLQSDLAHLIEQALDQNLNQAIIGWDARTAVGVVLAASGYPEAPKKGDVILGVEEANKIGKVFHAGTKITDNQELVTNGGRVLCVVGFDHGVEKAKKQAYQAVEKISFFGMQYRKDIADKAMKKS